MNEPGENVNPRIAKDERRGADRFPMERDVRFKILSSKDAEEAGLGKTVNMSSNGVLFTTDRFVVPGKRLEVAISWPAQLNAKVALKLVARGRVVRCQDGTVAIEIQQHEFRTQSNGGAAAAHPVSA